MSRPAVLCCIVLVLVIPSVSLTTRTRQLTSIRDVRATVYVGQAAGFPTQNIVIRTDSTIPSHVQPPPHESPEVLLSFHRMTTR